MKEKDTSSVWLKHEVKIELQRCLINDLDGNNLNYYNTSLGSAKLGKNICLGLYTSSYDSYDS